MSYSTLTHSLALLGSEHPEQARLEDILPLATYYPGGGFDGEPYSLYSKLWPCHVYVDYGIRRSQLMTELTGLRGLLGYRVLATRSLPREEVVLAGYRPPRVLSASDRPVTFVDASIEPFCEWVVLERDASRGDGHGPKRLGMLFLCGDGVASYDGLYNARNLLPAAVLIKDHGFGGNWTRFSEPKGPLWRVVTRDGNGPMPKLVLQYQRNEAASCWQDQYSAPALDLRRGNWVAFCKLTA